MYGGLLVSVLVGCDREVPSVEIDPMVEPEVPDDATDPAPLSVPLPEDVPSPVPWHAVGELWVDDFGEAGWISVPFPADQRYVALRTVPIGASGDAEARTCHRVVEARLASGASLLPEHDAVPLAEHQRLQPGPGAGVFVLSSTAAPLHEADTLEIRVALVDCDLGIAASRARFPGMPHALAVDAAWESEPSTTDATLAVRVIRAEDSGWGSTAEDPVFAEAWAVASERFADVGVELVLEAEIPVPAFGPVRYAADMLGFDALDQRVREHAQADPSDGRFVPVALVPCLEYDDPTGGTRMRPMGQTTRIPGSLADARTPSLVALSAGDCEGDGSGFSADPQRLGIVLAHELAHYLGLLHGDFDGAHLAGDEAQQLMHSGIAVHVDPHDAWFSPDQAVVLRRHPDVVFSR